MVLEVLGRMGSETLLLKPEEGLDANRFMSGPQGDRNGSLHRRKSGGLDSSYPEVV